MATLIFCFGSNLDDTQMVARCPAREKVGNAVLRGHRLCFPRLSDRRGCGVSSVERAEGHEVWGVVHRLNETDLPALDAHEGYRPGRAAELNRYNRVAVVVEIDGVATKVETYVAVATKPRHQMRIVSGRSAMARGGMGCRRRIRRSWRG